MKLFLSIVKGELEIVAIYGSFFCVGALLYGTVKLFS